MNEAFLFTLGLVLVGIPGGALLALLWTHPPHTRFYVRKGWRKLKRWARDLVPVPPVQIPHSFFRQ